jgi:transposase
MALGKRGELQEEMWVPTAGVDRGPGHPFYRKLNAVLAEADFDRWVEGLCKGHYAKCGRPGIPPGVYFRMLLVGFFEDIGTQRGIAWRCADSMSLREFLGLGMSDSVPDHSSMTVIRRRLSDAVYTEVFRWVLKLLRDKGLLDGKTLGVDATTLEANAAMKSIVRREGGEGWMEYLKRLAKAEGIAEPTAEDARRLDRRRKGKKVSNDDWHNPHDPDARITKMKDGTTGLAYKAEHAVDLNSQAIVAATVAPGDTGDTSTITVTVLEAQNHMEAAGVEVGITEAVADKGYHSAESVAQLQKCGVRTYVAEKKQGRRRWVKRPAAQRQAVHTNRRRLRGQRGKRLQRRRSEICERSFAHVCETGGGRRAWVKGIQDVNKIHLMKCMAFNLGLLMRKVLGSGKPRQAADALRAVLLWLYARIRVIRAIRGACSGLLHRFFAPLARLSETLAATVPMTELARSSTGC